MQPIVVDRDPGRGRWLLADVATKLATVAILAWAVASPDLPQFQGKAFAGRAIAYPVALLALPALWWIFARRRMPFPVVPDILLGLPFLIDVVGNALNLYDTIEAWDDLNHLVNWGLHTAAVGLLLRHGPWGPRTRTALAFTWAVTTAVLWELAEFATFVQDSPEAATAYADTLGDLALGMLGGLVAAVITARLPRVRLDDPSAAGRRGDVDVVGEQVAEAEPPVDPVAEIARLEDADPVAQ